MWGGQGGGGFPAAQSGGCPFGYGTQAPSSYAPMDGYSSLSDAVQGFPQQPSDAVQGFPQQPQLPQPKLSAEQELALQQARQLFKEGILTQQELDREVDIVLERLTHVSARHTEIP